MTGLHVESINYPSTEGIPLHTFFRTPVVFNWCGLACFMVFSYVPDIRSASIAFDLPLFLVTWIVYGSLCFTVCDRIMKNQHGDTGCIDDVVG